MMRLLFQQEYKSIRHLPAAEELPDFIVVTGANGAGKTHLLEALTRGNLRLEGIEPDKIKYYNWSSMAQKDVGPVQPRDLENMRNETCSMLATICAFLRESILSRARQQAQSFGVTSSITSQDLYAGVTHTSVSQIGRQSTLPQIISYVTREVNLVRAIESGHAVNYYKNENGQQKHLQLLPAQFPACLHILRTSSKPFFDLTEADCFASYPLVPTEQDPFVGSLTDLFANYVMTRAKNAMNKVLAEEEGEAGDYLTQEQFAGRYGLPPWEVFNQVLAEAKLPFEFQKPPSDPSRPLTVQLWHKVANREVRFADLSSGERVLISLTHFLFFAQDLRQPTAMPDVVLLDEVDAPLHPSMTAALLTTVEKVMVQQYQRRVILATHSPSTVALAPESAIYVLDADTKNLRKVTRDEGVRVLTVGVPTLSIDLANRRQAFVESQHDVALYERIMAVARPHLLPDVSLTFMAVGHAVNGGCALLTSLVQQLTDAGNRAIFGIVDWDGERTASGNLRVLGENVRHSIENYLFDPVLLGALLLREKAPALRVEPPLLRDRENYFELRYFDDDRLQQIADAVAVALNFPLTDLVPVQYANGRTVQMPQAYLHLRGHDLEERIKQKFPHELKRFHQEPKLKEEMLHKILEDIPELLPADFITLLREIQEGRG